MYLGKAKEIGWCRECKQPIYDYEQNILKMYHVKCLQLVKDKKKYAIYRIPSTGGTIKLKK
jgi:hypothetical protein